jgi:hypothetical protein
VPYGGDDRTEEIDPVAFDTPFAFEEQKRPPALSGAAVAQPPGPQRQSPSASLRDFEMNVPVTQVALSDLFDSTPAPGLMAPPDPAAFSSSRPPPQAKAAAEAASVSTTVSPVVALPNISVQDRSVQGEPALGARASVGAASHQTPSRQPAVAKPERERRSVPTLESVGSNAAAAKEPSAKQTPEKTGSARQAAMGSAEPNASENAVPLFPSDVPTSRPPDVFLSPGPAASPSLRSSGARPEAEPPRGLQSAVTVPAATNPNAAGQLPSIILGADVEAEPDISQRRALRAGRATVRIELPQDFMRPGSPLYPGMKQPGAARSSAPPPGTAELPTRVVSAAPSGARLLQTPVPAALRGLHAKKLWWIVAAAALLIACLILALRPRSGSLVVTALGPGNRAVDSVQIFVDDQPLCDVSPCRIKGLAAGVHTLRASAPDLASQAEETVEITAGEEATYNIDLLGAGPEVKAGGLRIPAGPADLTLYVDGKRVGKLPQNVSGLSGGKHWIKLDPEDGSDSIEKSVTIVPGQTVQVDPKAAKREKALVTIRLSPGSEGASVTLDDAFLLDFPAELELDPKSSHTLSATKPGYEDFSMEVQLDDGESEKLIEVALTPIDGASPPVRRARPKAAKRPAAAKSAPSTTVADPTQGLLNISSIPPSQIILNGRPLGSTPKMGIAVPGDSLQTIVFVHPKMGRRRAQKFVPAGKQRTVSIRF